MEARVRREPYSYRDDPRVPDFPDDRPLIVFDGHCVFCSRWAAFVRDRDPHARFRLAVTQSPLGRALYAHYELDADATNLLLEHGVPLTKSAAVLGVLRGLGFPWSLAGVLGLAPRPLRDSLYDVLARNRLRLGGRSETCMVPTQEEAERFLA